MNHGKELTKKNKIIFTVLMVYLVSEVVYFSLGALLSGMWQIQYRLAVRFVMEELLVIVPLFFIGYACCEGIAQKHQSSGKFPAGLHVLFLLYVIAAVFFVLGFTIFRWVFLNDTSESRAKDGNLLVTRYVGFMDDHPEQEYRKPIAVLFSKAIVWDNSEYARTMGKLYGISFTADTSDPKTTRFVSSQYPEIRNRVYGVLNDRNRILDDDYELKLTGYYLKKQFAEYMIHGEKIQEYRGEKNDRDSVPVLVVLREDQEEAATDVSHFIDDQLKTDRYQHITGDILCLLRQNPSDDGTLCEITFDSQDIWYDKAQTVANRFDECFRSGAADPAAAETAAGAESVSETVNRPETVQSSEAESAAERQALLDSQPLYAGFPAICAQIEGASGNITDQIRWNTKGDPYVVVKETPEEADTLYYDRESANGKCALFVYYREKKQKDGSYSLSDDTAIITMYAYRYDTETVYDSGRRSWTDAGSKAYREAAGE